MGAALFAERGGTGVGAEVTFSDVDPEIETAVTVAGDTSAAEIDDVLGVD